MFSGDCEISREAVNLLESIADSLTNHNIELLIVDNNAIRALNAEFLGRDYATDVLSFPLDNSGIRLDLRESGTNHADFGSSCESSAIDSHESQGMIRMDLGDSHESQGANHADLGESRKSSKLPPLLQRGLGGGLESQESQDFMILLGSIVISIDKANEMARIYGHSLENELAILFTHGLLHLLGYDHECDNGEHRKKEREILAQFGIDGALIERNLDSP